MEAVAKNRCVRAYLKNNLQPDLDLAGRGEGARDHPGGPDARSGRIEDSGH